MFTYLAINFWKRISSHTFLNSQEQYLQKKKKLFFFSTDPASGTCFSLQSGFQLLSEGK